MDITRNYFLSPVVGVLIGIFFLALVGPCRGDELVLVSGRHLQGEIVSLEGEEVTLKTPDNEFLINLKMVEKVEAEAKTDAKKELVENIRRKIGERPAIIKRQPPANPQRRRNKSGIEVLRPGQDAAEE